MITLIWKIMSWCWIVLTSVLSKTEIQVMHWSWIFKSSFVLLLMIFQIKEEWDKKNWKISFECVIMNNLGERKEEKGNFESHFTLSSISVKIWKKAANPSVSMNFFTQESGLYRRLPSRFVKFAKTSDLDLSAWMKNSGVSWIWLDFL